MTNRQFKDFVERVEENISSIKADKGRLARKAKGYKILQATGIHHSPYQYEPKKQKKFDSDAARKLTEKYSSESVQKVIQEMSPLGLKNKNYGREILQEIRTNGR